MRAGGASALIALFGVIMLAVLAGSAHAELKPIDPMAAESAQAVPPSAFGAPSSAQQPPAFASPSAAQQSPGAFSGIFGWVLRTQQSMQRELATGVKSLKGDNAMAGAVMLAALSFLYGVVHAVGPGHGKMVISSYVVANEQTVRRGVIISFIAAGLQALTAVALVGILAFALNASALQINAWSNQLEMVSYALIALVGAWLLGTRWSALGYSGRSSSPSSGAGRGRARPRRMRAIPGTITLTASTIITTIMAMLITIMPRARPAVISSMRASWPGLSLGARSLPWCSRSASGHAPARSSCSFLR